MITYIKVQGYSVTHFDGKNHDKKEFQNLDFGGKHIEYSYLRQFSNNSMT